MFVVLRRKVRLSLGFDSALKTVRSMPDCYRMNVHGRRQREAATRDGGPLLPARKLISAEDAGWPVGLRRLLSQQVRRYKILAKDPTSYDPITVLDRLV